MTITGSPPLFGCHDTYLSGNRSLG